MRAVPSALASLSHMLDQCWLLCQVQPSAQLAGLLQHLAEPAQMRLRVHKGEHPGPFQTSLGWPDGQGH